MTVSSTAEGNQKLFALKRKNLQANEKPVQLTSLCVRKFLAVFVEWSERMGTETNAINNSIVTDSGESFRYHWVNHSDML